MFSDGACLKIKKGNGEYTNDGNLESSFTVRCKICWKGWEKLDLDKTEMVKHYQEWNEPARTPWPHWIGPRRRVGRRSECIACSSDVASTIVCLSNYWCDVSFGERYVLEASLEEICLHISEVSQTLDWVPYSKCDSIFRVLGSCWARTLVEWKIEESREGADKWKRVLSNAPKMDFLFHEVGKHSIQSSILVLCVGERKCDVAM